MRHLLFAVGLSVCPALAISQQSVPAKLSLADAIALARSNNPAYRQTLHDRAPAAWGVRNAFANTFLPTLTASGGVGYAGPGQQRFLTQNFSQGVSTLSSNYTLALDWTLNGQTLSQPGLKHAQLVAADADITGAETGLVTAVTQQYLTVLEAQDHAAVARRQFDVNDQSLTLARARYEVGRSSLVDVRSAQVARGQAEVALLQADMAVSVEKLRLFQDIGVAAPVEIDRVQLTDTFPVTTPPWKLSDLLTLAEAQNPALRALRAREGAAGWGVKAAASSWGPSLSVSAAWSGFTQKLSDINPTLAGIDQNAVANDSVCAYWNAFWLNPGGPAVPCGFRAAAGAQKQAAIAQNAAYPFQFTPQPFQARLTISIPLWGNFQQPLAVSQAKAQENDLTESVRARGLQLQTDVNQAYLTVTTAYRTIAIQDTSRTAGREQLQLATERYRVGSGTFVELLNAQLLDLQAETDYVTAVYNYHKSVAALEAAVGRPLR
ncbi:MAG TPA: TolC family protein [Gemmatimonadales bacterium]|jgi:outer membrane protein|nr:TolC family protein [Gemmatimonadales bacterium]